MTVLIYVCLGLALTVIAQSIVIVRVTRAFQSFGRFGDRIAHLAAAMELLTDTTEAGLGNVAVALDKSAPHRAVRATRAATSKRITSAARRGGSISEIAANELLSESEVRLHMTLAEPEGEHYGSLRG
jgi:hypothetical protein